MDTSETYIKMCERAEEIRKDHEWEAGDWGYWPENGDINIMYMGEYIPSELGEGHIWLPRQDQLQEMLSNDVEDAIDKFYCLREFGDYPFGLIGSGLISTMEQLWLAFVMKEKYNKVWNGEEWRSK